MPDELKKGPITIEQAEAAGVSRFRLRGSSWRRLGRGSYVWVCLPDDPLFQLVALAQRLPAGFAFSHLTAAWLHGIDVGIRTAVHVVLPSETRSSARAGLQVHRGRLDRGDVTRRRGLPVTSPLRTCLDLARDLQLVEAVAAVDMALHDKLVHVGDLRARVEQHAGERGVRQARQVVELAEPRTESPMESRLRMVLVMAGLPPPEAQVTLRQGTRFLGRPDLCYRQARLCIEYDGEVHRKSLAADNQRQNRLVSAGYKLLRYTATDVYQRPEHIVAEVAHFLDLPPRAFERLAARSYRSNAR